MLNLGAQLSEVLVIFFASLNFAYCFCLLAIGERGLQRMGIYDEIGQLCSSLCVCLFTMMIRMVLKLVIQRRASLCECCSLVFRSRRRWVQVLYNWNPRRRRRRRLVMIWRSTETCKLCNCELVSGASCIGISLNLIGSQIERARERKRQIERQCTVSETDREVTH